MFRNAGGKITEIIVRNVKCNLSVSLNAGLCNKIYFMQCFKFYRMVNVKIMCTFEEINVDRVGGIFLFSCFLLRLRDDG
jgi:hypothetical protein